MAHLDELIQKVLNAKDKLSLQNLKSELLGKNSQINQDFKNNKVHTNFFENNLVTLTSVKTHF